MATYLNGDRVMGDKYIIRHNPAQSRSSISPCVLPVKQVRGSDMQVSAKKAGNPTQGERVEQACSLSSPTRVDWRSPPKNSARVPHQELARAVSISMAPELASILDKENFHQKNLSNAAGSKTGFEGTPSTPAHEHENIDIGADDTASFAIHYSSVLGTTSKWSMVRNICENLIIPHRCSETDLCSLHTITRNRTPRWIRPKAISLRMGC